MEVQIVPATQEHIPIIFQFIKELAEYEQLAEQVVATEALLAEHLFSEHPKAEVILGYMGDEPIGFALFYGNFSTFRAQPGIFLEDIYVKPQFRSLRVGRKLLNYIARQAVERNLGRLCWLVQDWNEPAIQFYRRMGAVPKDEWTMFGITDGALEELANSM